MSRRAWLYLTRGGRVRAVTAEEPSPEWRSAAARDGETFVEMVPSDELAALRAENERLRAVNPWTQTNVDARWAMHYAETAWITAWDAEWRAQVNGAAAQRYADDWGRDLTRLCEVEDALGEACALLADARCRRCRLDGHTAEDIAAWCDRRDAFCAKWGRK